MPTFNVTQTKTANVDDAGLSWSWKVDEFGDARKHQRRASDDLSANVGKVGTARCEL